MQEKIKIQESSKSNEEKTAVQRFLLKLKKIFTVLNLTIAVTDFDRVPFQDQNNPTYKDFPPGNQPDGYRLFDEAESDIDIDQLIEKMVQHIQTELKSITIESILSENKSLLKDVTISTQPLEIAKTFFYNYFKKKLTSIIDTLPSFDIYQNSVPFTAEYSTTETNIKRAVYNRIHAQFDELSNEFAADLLSSIELFSAREKILDSLREFFNRVLKTEIIDSSSNSKTNIHDEIISALLTTIEAIRGELKIEEIIKGRSNTQIISDLINPRIFDILSQLLDIQYRELDISSKINVIGNVGSEILDILTKQQAIDIAQQMRLQAIKDNKPVTSWKNITSNNNFGLGDSTEEYMIYKKMYKEAEREFLEKLIEKGLVTPRDESNTHHSARNIHDYPPFHALFWKHYFHVDIR